MRRPRAGCGRPSTGGVQVSGGASHRPGRPRLPDQPAEPGPGSSWWLIRLLQPRKSLRENEPVPQVVAPKSCSPTVTTAAAPSSGGGSCDQRPLGGTQVRQSDRRERAGEPRLVPQPGGGVVASRASFTVARIRPGGPERAAILSGSHVITRRRRCRSRHRARRTASAESGARGPTRCPRDSGVGRMVGHPVRHRRASGPNFAVHADSLAGGGVRITVPSAPGGFL